MKKIYRTQFWIYDMILSKVLSRFCSFAIFAPFFAIGFGSFQYFRHFYPKKITWIPLRYNFLYSSSFSSLSLSLFPHFDSLPLSLSLSLSPNICLHHYRHFRYFLLTHVHVCLCLTHKHVDNLTSSPSSSKYFWFGYWSCSDIGLVFENYRQLPTQTTNLKLTHTYMHM